MRAGLALVAVFFLLLHLAPLEAASQEAVERNNLGAQLLQQGKLTEAIFEFQKAIRLDPSHGPARVNLAYAYDRQGWTDEAIAEYRRAIELEPRNPILRNNLGVLYNKKALYDEAIDAFENALRIDPNDPNALKNLEIAKKNKVDAPKGEEEILQAQRQVDANPNNPNALYKLARLYAYYGKKDQAMEGLEKALKLGFNDIELLKRDPALENLRADPAFARFVGAL